MIYQNYHKHSMYSNVRVPDSVASYQQYADKAKEYGQSILSSVEHGWQGRYIETYEIAKETGLKMLFGTETYFVFDRTIKDSTNAHMIILAKNENGRKAINRILSEANITGFYYQPRVDFELVLSLPPEDVWVTSACLAGPLKYTQEKWDKIIAENPDLGVCYDLLEEPYVFIIKALQKHFGKNFFLEVQSHHTDSQKIANTILKKLSYDLDIKMIAGVDSHYISDDKAWERTEYLASRGLHYEDEDGWFMDYPDGDTLFQRFKEQGILTDEEILAAMDQTNTFLSVEEYSSTVFDQEVKMPILPMYKDLNQDERDAVFTKLVWDKWLEEKHFIEEPRWPEYEAEIKKEIDTVVPTGLADYFLLDYEMVKLGKEKGGSLTYTGRGSAAGFYLTHLLGLTSIDRISCPVRLYPERFISKTRILESKSLPDIDLNCGNTAPFIEAQEELMGKGRSYPMIAFGTYKVKSAWKLFAKAQNIAFDLATAVADQIDDYLEDLKNADEDKKDEVAVEDYISEEYQEIFNTSKVYRDIVASVSIHPCFTGNQIVLTKQGSKRIEDILVGDIVLGENNEYNVVTNTMNRESDDIYEVDILGIGKVTVTGNHPFLVENLGDDRKTIVEKTWKPASLLIKGDRVCICENKESIIPAPTVISININGFSDRKDSLPTSSPDFWWIVGRYMGDGWRKNTRQTNKGERLTIICCGKGEEQEIVEKVRQLNHYGCYVTEEETVKRVNIQSKNLYDFLEQFGDGAKNKHLTSTILDLPNVLLLSFLNGYFSADGSVAKNSQSFSTASRILAYDIAACVRKAYKIPCRIAEDNHEGGSIGGREIRGGTRYVGRFSVNAKKRSFVRSDGYLLARVRSIKKVEKKETVYNLEVSNSHTYNVQSIVVHNCAMLIFQGDIPSEIGLMQVNDNLCSIMDGKWADKYKFLKNDLLTVSVVEFIAKTFERVRVPHLTSRELLALCDKNHPCWDIYKNAWTVGINQCEQSGSAHKVSSYKPRNISELAAFVAAIRPGFKSMYATFEKRKDFSYGIPTIDALIKTEQFPQSFMLYQEQAMSLLNYSGIPLDETYTIIKAIAKKKPEKIQAYKQIFLSGMAKKIVENEKESLEKAEEVAQNVWQIISDSQRYSFNSAHALAVGIDSLYGAYLKSTYPLEFYETYLRVMEENNKKDKMLAAQQEAVAAYNIKFLPMRFGQDNRQIVCHPEDNSITSSIQSLKGFSKKASYALYTMKDFVFKDFIDLLYYIKENTCLNSGHVDILIALNYFQRFGGNLKLKKIYALFNGLYDSERSIKDIPAKKITELGINADIALECCEHFETKEKDYFYVLDKKEFVQVEGEKLSNSLGIDMFQTKGDHCWNIHSTDTGILLFSTTNKACKKDAELRGQDTPELVKKWKHKIDLQKNKDLISPKVKLDPIATKYVDTKYFGTNVHNLLSRCENIATDEIMPFKDQIVNELEYLSYISTTFDFLPKRFCFIEELDVKYKPRLILYCFKTGKRTEIRIPKKIFDKNKIKPHQVISANLFKKTEVYNPPDADGKYVIKPGVYEWSLMEYDIVEDEKFENILKKGMEGEISEK